jgi:hypothetical protein
MRRCALVAALLLVGVAGCKDTSNTAGGSGSGGGGPTNFDVKIRVAGSGRVTSTPAGIDCGATCAASFAVGTSVGLSAAPDSGWRFAGWSGDCSGNGGCQIISSASVTATFEQLPPPPPASHRLTVTRGGSGLGRVTSQPAGIDCGGSCETTFVDGTTIALSAAATNGSTFAGWDGACSGAGSCSVKMTSDAAVTARFDAQPADDCAGLVPPAPGAPSQFKWANQDLGSMGGSCFPAETDGTGHIAVSWQHAYQPHDSRFTFVDPAGRAVGSFTGTGLLLIGQASGFMGGECAGAMCSQDYVVLDPTGNLLHRGGGEGTSNNMQANDPMGGMIHARLLTDSAYTITMLLDAIDAGGAVRWTRTLPDTFKPSDRKQLLVGVDREGNVLTIWQSDQRYGAGTWAGEWMDHGGTPGPVFQVMSSSSYPVQFYERVGSGLFLSGFPGWLGQFDAQATSMSLPPPWLASRPDTKLHMVHGGKGYAVLPAPGSNAACEQVVEVISPSGKVCGSSKFAVGGGSCTTSSIIVGYDGTVVQQLPREREAPCTAADHQCDCTYRYWSGYFR